MEYLETLSYVVGNQSNQIITVVYNGFDLNTVFHQFEIISGEGDVDFSVDSSNLTEGNLSISVNLAEEFRDTSDPITRINWSWGDGTGAGATGPAIPGALDLDHTYETSGFYTITVTVVRASGQVSIESMVVDALSPLMLLPAPTGLSALAGDKQIIISWDEVEEAESYNIYYARQSFGNPPNIQNYASFDGGMLAQNIVESSFLVENLENNARYYFIIVAQSAEKGGYPSVEISEITDKARGAIELISVGLDGRIATGGSSVFPSLSSDGRYVAFVSSSSNLVPGGTNERDVYVFDRELEVMELISVSIDGERHGGAGGRVSISGTGRYVAFLSQGSNLVGDDTNNIEQVLVRDRLLKRTELVSISTNGVLGNVESRDPKISVDGRFIVFTSASDNLVVNDGNNLSDIFIHDRELKTTTLVSVAEDGRQNDAPSSAASISANGRYVVFRSGESSLLNGIQEGIFLKDTNFETIELISVPVEGHTPPVNVGALSSSISENGRYVAFSANTSFDPRTKFGVGVYLRDRVEQTTTLITVPIVGNSVGGSFDSKSVEISSDGNYVSFYSISDKLVENDLNESGDIFVYDIRLKDLKIVSLDANQQQTTISNTGGTTISQTISSDGKYIAFHARPQGIIQDDFDRSSQIFLVENR